MSDDADAAGGEEKDDDIKGLVKTTNGITSYVLWERGTDLPASKKRLDFKKRSGDFEVTICYDDPAGDFLPAGEDKLIGDDQTSPSLFLILSLSFSLSLSFILSYAYLFLSQLNIPSRCPQNSPYLILTPVPALVLTLFLSFPLSSSAKYTIKMPPELVASGPHSVRVIFQVLPSAHDTPYRYHYQHITLSHALAIRPFNTPHHTPYHYQHILLHTQSTRFPFSLFFQLDKHSLVGIAGAELMEEIAYVEVIPLDALIIYTLTNELALVSLTHRGSTMC